MVVADEGGRLGLDIGDDIVTGGVVDVEPGGALVVRVSLIPLAEEVVGVVAAVVPADPDLAVGQNTHPRVILVFALCVGVDLGGGGPGDAAIGRAAEESVAVEAGRAAAAVGAFQVAAGIDHVDVAGVSRAGAHDRVATRAERLIGVDAEDAAPGLGGRTGSALDDIQFGGDRPSRPAIGRAGHFVADARRTADVLVIVLLVAHVNPAIRGYARLGGLLIAGGRDWVADQELRAPTGTAVGGLVAGDATRR